MRATKAPAKRGPEPFFIKNLENVQGDKRDVIMISLTYGREVGQERVAQRFGPIARSQGHRRLNVLFTRARELIVLFSSMGSDDILVSPTTKRLRRTLHPRRPGEGQDPYAVSAMLRDAVRRPSRNG
jgi:superfamily I DNA and/or RNA helicase